MGVTYRKHVVKKGEYLVDIVRSYGWKKQDWRGLYDLKANAHLRKKRPDPNHVEPGDVVLVPKVSRAELITGRKYLTGLYEAHMKMTAPLKAYKARVERLRKEADKADAKAALTDKQVAAAKTAVKDASKHFKNAMDIASTCKLGTREPNLNPIVAALLCKRENDETFAALRKVRERQAELEKAERSLGKDAKAAQKAHKVLREEARMLPALTEAWRANHKKTAGVLKDGITKLERAMGDTF